MIIEVEFKNTKLFVDSDFEKGLEIDDVNRNVNRM